MIFVPLFLILYISSACFASVANIYMYIYTAHSGGKNCLAGRRRGKRGPSLGRPTSGALLTILTPRATHSNKRVYNLNV